MTLQFTNNAQSTLASGISNSDTSIVVATGQGTLFPSPSGGDTFRATLVRASDGAIEIVDVTARSTDTLTVTRAQEGTTGLAFVTGDRIECRITAAFLNNQNVAVQTNAASSKTTPVDADELPLADSAAAYALKKLTWANLKATMAAYYGTLTATLTNKTLTTPVINGFSGTGIGSITANSASAALTVTQTGAGNAFVVEDSASTDSTPFVIDAVGAVGVGAAPDLAGKAQKLYVTDPAWATVWVEGSSTTAFVNSQVSTNATPAQFQFRKARGTVSAQLIVADSDRLGEVQFYGYDGTTIRAAASIVAKVDGTPGASDMPGRLEFFTTADGASSPTEAMRVDSTQSITNLATGSGTNAYGFRVTSAKVGGTNNYAFSGEIAAGANRYNFYAAGTADNYFAGSVGIGVAPYAGTDVIISKALTGNTVGYGLAIVPAVNSDVTSAAYGVGTYIGTQAASFTLSGLYHFSAGQNAIGAGSTVMNQIGFSASASLTGATNNFGFYSNIAAAANRWNFYAGGTAANYFAGDVQLGKTVTAGGTTGAQTINKTVGTVNFAAAATSLVVTNSLVTANSIITATVGTNDTTMKSVAVVAAAGSFTLHANAAATAETRVNFCVFN